MRLVDANDVVKDILKERDKVPLTSHFGEALRGGIRKALRCIEQAPTIDAVPVVHGRWIKDGCYNKCSVCGECVHNWNDDGDVQRFNYCPNCGARMDLKDGDK